MSTEHRAHHTIDIEEPHVITERIQEPEPQGSPGVPGAASQEIVERPEVRKSQLQPGWTGDGECTNRPRQ